MAETRTPSTVPFDPSTISRPDPALWTYYIIVALLTVFGFPVVIWPLYFRYRTLRYRFDDKGVSMSYGILFHREIYLTYRRIQDIHVTRNIIHRWLGLATVAVQTASGTSGAQMTIEGIRNPEGLRDFLYAQMRGARGLEQPAESARTMTAHSAPAIASAAPNSSDEALDLLRQIRNALRQAQLKRGGGGWSQ